MPAPRMCVCAYMYIYIQREREREKEIILLHSLPSATTFAYPVAQYPNFALT